MFSESRIRRQPNLAAALQISLSMLILILSIPATATVKVESIPSGMATRGDKAGTSIAIAGNRVAVGAPSANPVVDIPSGAVEIFVSDAGGTWNLEAVLKASDARPGLTFGSRVMLLPDLVVATTDEGIATPSSVYTFEWTGTEWVQVDRFVHTASAHSGAALSGDTLAFADGTIYVRSGNGWSAQTVLGPDAGSGEQFFAGVALEGNRVVLGSQIQESLATSHYFAYVFTRSGSSWTREGKIDLGIHNAFSGLPMRFALSGSTIIASTDSGVDSYIFNGANWAHEGILDPLGTTLSFGSALAIHGDRAIVSATADNILGHSEAGSLYVFDRSGGAWNRTMRLYDPQAGDFYFNLGASIAFEGDTIVAGSPNATTDAGASGKASVFATSGGTWSLVADLSPGNSNAAEAFGSSSSSEADTIIVGAPGAASDSVWVTGAAYVFDRLGGSWQQSGILAPPTTGRSQGFGQSVSLDGNTVAIGAPRDDTVGAVYVYFRNGSTWDQQARLGAGTTQVTLLGWSVALRGDRLVAGEPYLYTTSGPPGAARVYERSGSAWNEAAILHAGAGSSGDAFGASTDLSGDTIVVGAPRAEVGIEQDAGAAYVFRQVGGVWIEEATLVAPMPLAGALFGGSVSISGDTIVVGAGAAEPTTSARGGAYVYVRSGGLWSPEATLQPIPGEASKSYGTSVSVSESGNLILVGAPYRSTAPLYPGAVYSFRRDGSGWTPSSIYSGAAPIPPYPRPDQFGAALSISGDDAVIGAPGDGYKGAAYLESVGQTIFAGGFD